MRKLSIRLIITAVLCAVLATAGFATQITKQLAPGVSFYQDINTDPASALIVNAVTVDLSNPSVKVRPAIACDTIQTNDWKKGREAVSTLTGRRNAILGINADFFPFTGDPLGVCVIDGELVSEPGNNRVGMALLDDGCVYFDNPRLDAKIILPRGTSRQIEGINRPRETNQVIAYTETFGDSTQSKYKGTDIVLKSGELPVTLGREISLEVVEVKPDALNTPIPKGGMVISAGGPAAWFLKENLKPGDTVRVLFNMKSASNVDWTRVRQSVGGGPWLVRDGQPFVNAADEGFKADFSNNRHPRTALGVTADNKLMFVTVDGRQSISRGISLPDLAKLMIKLGARHAINLDGGGSTAMSVRGMVVNSPSEGVERLIADAVLVWADEKDRAHLPKLTISGVGNEVALGDSAQLFLTWGDDCQMLTQEQLNSVAWGVGKGIGFINQKGYFIPLRLGEGTIEASYGSQVVRMPVKVVPGLPALVNVELIPDTNDPLTATAKVTVLGKQNNKLSGRQVVLSVVGGTADAVSGVTSSGGEFTTVVRWQAGATERSVKAVVGDISGSAAMPVAETPSQPEPVDAGVVQETVVE